MERQLPAAIGRPRPFTIGPTLDGYEVIAIDTGRPVSESGLTPQQANGKAQHLNNAAANGPRALARALRAT